MRNVSRLVGKSRTRRSFLKATAASALWCQARGARGATASLGRLPRLDGEILLGDADRRAAADDWGHAVHRAPLAVVRPGSVSDVARMVGFANERGLKLAMRGQGHSPYGQAQADGGLVIDSSPLDRARPHDRALDVEPGVLVGTALKAALALGQTLPVVPDVLMLSMGGLLSVGGTGETSHRSGALVDHVEELDVVTGAGELLTCSLERNEELFRMALAGLGQCGLIVRARLRLVGASSHVAIRRLTYRHADGFVDDLARLAGGESLGPLAGEITRGPDGGWQFTVLAGTFLSRPEESAGRPAWMEALGHSAEAPPAVTPLWEFLDRRTASVAATKAAGKPNPSIAFYLPERSVKPFLGHVLSTPEASIGIWRIEVLPLPTTRFTQLLHVLPAGPVAFALRLQRRASAEGAADHEAMLEANRNLGPRLQAAGGKIYPPYSPIPTRDEWRGHYGAETWARFAAAKERFDPNHVLTPGAGLF